VSAREEVLRRIREANALAGAGDSPRASAGEPAVVRAGDLEGFAANVEDYRAQVVRTNGSDLPSAIAGVAVDLGLRSVVVPEGLPESWTLDLPESVAQAPESAFADLPAGALEEVDAVLTGSTVSIARTGTIVLDHGAGQGRRALTLVPDVHLCVVPADTVVEDVPDAVARLTELGAQQRPLTWVSGPSATSDIELSRVEGVHGPRTLVVFVVS
jgi:L-lactate dehydrogenase complex protein LldG